VALYGWSPARMHGVPGPVANEPGTPGGRDGTTGAPPTVRHFISTSRVVATSSAPDTRTK